MDPVILHEDGTECRHAGKPQRAYEDADGPACAAGIPVTHVRILGSEMTLAEASQMVGGMVAAFKETVVPVIARYAERLAEVATSPEFRVLATAVERAQGVRRLGAK